MSSTEVLPKKGVAHFPIYNYPPRILNRGTPFPYASHTTLTSSPDEIERNSIWKACGNGGVLFGVLSGSQQHQATPEPAHIETKHTPEVECIEQKGETFPQINLINLNFHLSGSWRSILPLQHSNSTLPAIFVLFTPLRAQNRKISEQIPTRHWNIP